VSAELERLALACIWPGFPGLEPPDWVRQRLSEGLGGVVLFGRNCRDLEQVAALSAALRAERPDVIVATDEEGGDVTRLEVETGSSFPGNWALGVVDETATTEAVARQIGSLCATAGVNLNLAPVADVNSNPRNPVIGVRSFGTDPELVARHVAAYVRGVQSVGVAACAKHFPGHGDTEADSHLELPVAQGDLSDALVPFRAAIEAGVQSMMTAHLVVPELDDAPATVSRRVLTELLRDELGFDGLVVTDALEMKGLAATVGVEQGAVWALAAGADALCLGFELGDDTVLAVRDAIVEAVRSGELAEERLAEAAARVARGWAVRPRPVDSEVGLDAARRALRVEGDAALRRPAVVVELLAEPNIAAGPAAHSLAALLGSEAVDADEALVQAETHQLVIVLRDAHRYEWARNKAERLLAASPDAIVVETGLPYWRPESARAYVATHGAGRANLQAASDRLQGAA